MSDQCKFCLVRGDIDKCLQTDCSHHENWISEQHRLRLDQCQANLELVMDVNKQLRNRIQTQYRENMELQRTLDNMKLLNNWEEGDNE